MLLCYILAKLWTAPEILRMNFPLERGTPKGDVYSFAIIAYEIMMRSEPYPFDTMTPRGKISDASMFVPKITSQSETRISRKDQKRAHSPSLG